MDPRVTAAIVAGIIAFLASYIVAVYQSRAEIRKFAKQLEEKYTTALFEKRLDAYPLLFKMLSRLSNSIEGNSQDTEQLVDLQEQYDEWVSSYGVLLTPSTARILWRYRSYLSDVVNQYSREDVPEDQWVLIRNTNVTIGKFLRAELGVFDTDAAGTVELEQPNIKELLEKLGAGSDRTRDRFGY